VLQPLEVVTAKILPTIRSRLAQILLDEYDMRQVDVAQHLGITQAAVSHYKTASRGIDPALVKLFPEIDAYAHEIAAKIARGMPRTAQVLSLNNFLDRLMNTQRFCEYHKKVASLDPACNICFPSPPNP